MRNKAQPSTERTLTFSCHVMLRWWIRHCDNGCGYLVRSNALNTEREVHKTLQSTVHDSMIIQIFILLMRSNSRILYSIFFCQIWWPTCCFCVCDSFDEWEKSLGYFFFQKSSDGHWYSGLRLPLPQTSYNKSQNNINTIQLLKQRFKDRKCSLDFKTFL